jgi:acyl-CoA thioester hydrolase
MPTPHVCNYRVAYADTDRMGRVYYANYFVFAERARTELLRDVGCPYRAFEEGGLFFPVRQASARYHGAAHYDDLLTFSTRVVRRRHATLTCETRVRRGEGERLAVVTVELACVNGEGRPTPVPETLWKALAPHTDLAEDGGDA